MEAEARLPFRDQAGARGHGLRGFFRLFGIDARGVKVFYIPIRRDANSRVAVAETQARNEDDLDDRDDFDDEEDEEDDGVMLAGTQRPVDAAEEQTGPSWASAPALE